MRIVALCHGEPEEVREMLLSLIREFAAKARRSGLEFGLWWLVDVIDSGERRRKKDGNLPVADWRKYLAAGLRNKIEAGGMPRPPVAKPKPTARPAFDPAKLLAKLNAMGWDWEPISDGAGDIGIRWIELRTNPEKPNAAFQAVYEQNKAAIAEWLDANKAAAVATPIQGGETHA